MQNKGNQNRAPTQLIMSKFKIADWEDGTSDYYKEDDVVVTEGTAVLKQLRKCLRGKLHHSTISIGRRFQQFFSPEKRTTIYWRPKTSKPAFSYVIKIIVSFFGTAKTATFSPWTTQSPSLVPQSCTMMTVIDQKGQRT